jgi:hypothetical protein
VPHYDFNWQLLYEFGPERPAPRGTRFDVAAVWDNSVNNRYNPDPKSEVRWGDQSWEEMLLAWVTLQIDPDADVNKLFQWPRQREVLDKKQDVTAAFAAYSYDVPLTG